MQWDSSGENYIQCEIVRFTVINDKYQIQSLSSSRIINCCQGLSETLYTKTQAASTRQRREFVPKTLEDLGMSYQCSLSCDLIITCSGIETSCDLSQTAPHMERSLRGSSSNRSASQLTIISMMINDVLWYIDVIFFAWFLSSVLFCFQC